MDRREAHHDSYDYHESGHRGRRHDDDRDNYDYHPSQHLGQRYDDEERRPYQGQGRGHAPSTRDASAFALQGGLERGDFASDAEIERMFTSGEFDGRKTTQPQQQQEGYGRYDHDAPPGPPPALGSQGRVNEYGRYDTSPSGPPQGQGYGRYDAPSGPPPGRGQQFHQGYGSGGGPERQDQYGSQQPQSHFQYDSPQAPHSGYGKSHGNAPEGAFSASRDAEEYGGRPDDRYEPPRRGEAASVHHQQGQGDRYAHLAGMAQEHGDDDPRVYRQATQGLHDRIQAQAQSRRPHDEDDDYKAHVDAHRKAYGEDDRGPMDANAIGAAAAMEAFKQTAGSSKAPAGGFKTSGESASKKGEEEEEEETTTAARAGASGGSMQDKLMALAMSHAGKLFDKKNAGSTGGDKSQDKAQAMQSAAATAMHLFSQYQSKGKLESGDMSKVIGLAMNLL